MNLTVMKTDGRLLQMAANLEEQADGSIMLKCARCDEVLVHFTHTDTRQVDGLTLAVMHELEKHWQPEVAKAIAADKAAVDAEASPIKRELLKVTH